MHATTRPLRLVYRDEGLKVAVVRGYGYSARCECGWQGEKRQWWAMAQVDARAHNELHRV